MTRSMGLGAVLGASWSSRWSPDLTGARACTKGRVTKGLVVCVGAMGGRVLGWSLDSGLGGWVRRG